MKFNGVDCGGLSGEMTFLVSLGVDFMVPMMWRDVSRQARSQLHCVLVLVLVDGSGTKVEHRCLFIYQR